MSAPPDHQVVPPNAAAPPASHGLTWRGLAIVGLVYVIGVTVIVVGRAESSSDFRDFWTTALHYRQTGEIDASLGVHNYLPVFTILMTPWSLLPLRVAIVLFTWLSLTLFAATTVLVEELLYGQRTLRPRPATLVTISLLLPYVHSCAVLGQLGLILAFLLTATLAALRRGRTVRAGTLLGLGLTIKILPGLLLAYCVLRRKYLAAATGAVVAGVLCFGLPTAILGIDRTLALHREFYARAVQSGGAAATLLADQPLKSSYHNSALPMVLRRLLSPVDPDFGAGQSAAINFVNLPRRWIAGVYAVFALALLGATVWRTIRLPDKVILKDGSPVPEYAVYGAWCALLLLLSPLVWTHYLVLLYWPVALLVARIDQRLRTGRAAALLAGALWIIGVLLLASPIARAAGAQLAAVVVVWMAALAGAARPAGAAPAQEPFSA